MSNLNPLTLEAALSEVADWITAVNYAQAIARCNELIAAYPDAVRILRLRAQAFEHSNDPVRAADDFAHVLEALPADIPAASGLARCQLAMDQVREAVLTARMVLDHQPQDREAQRIALSTPDPDDRAPEPGRIAAARAKFSVGMVNRAVAELRRFLEAWPDRVDAQVVLAELLWRSNLKITTAELCQAILDAQPDCLNAHIILHNIWTRAGNTGLAEAHAHTIDRLDPDHRETRDWLGDAAPLPVRDVPAVVEPPAAPPAGQAADQDADEADRSAWVDELIAAAAPVSTPPNRSSADAGATQPDEDSDAVMVPDRLEWMPVSQGEEEAPADDVPEWLTNLRQQPGQPGPSVKPAPALNEDFEPIVPLQWTAGAQEANAVTAAQTAQAPQGLPPGDSSQPPTDASSAAGAAPGVISIDVPAGPESPALTPESATASTAPAMAAGTAARAPSVEAPAPAPANAAPRRARKSAKAKTKKAKLSNEDLLALARKAIETASYDQAAEFYARLIGAGKKLDAVQADLDVATHAYPDVRRFHVLLGDVYTRKGDVNAALIAYHRALGIN
jgi:tetratricopeptide (TPR) repeat protein